MLPSPAALTTTKTTITTTIAAHSSRLASYLRTTPRLPSVLLARSSSTAATATGTGSIATPKSLAHRPSRVPSSALYSRSKSTHHPTLPPSSKSPVLPKPSQPSSALPPEERNSQLDPHHPRPPLSQGPPRLVRYEQDPHTGQKDASLYPRSYAHTSYPDPLSYRAHLSNRRAPASLFGLFPSTTATAIGLKGSSDPYAYKGPNSTQTSVVSPTYISPSPNVEQPSGSEVSTTTKMAASTSSIINGAKSSEAELHQRKVGGASASTAGALPHSHSHSHSHDHHGHDHAGSVEEADALLAALKGKGDRGSNITLAGLVSNVGLCGAKGVAGVYLNSAALLADAAHSLSDMFADLVTLFCWKMSQKPPSASHPLGYGKYETMGSLGVSLVLVAGAVGIGFHSYGLLLETLQPTLQNAPAALKAFGQFTGSIASAGGLLHDHHDASTTESGGILDPNAMWFALLSIVVKEWLYHATLKIAREENSSVLEANALHHRSDSLSSAVTFLAIGGSWLGFPVLDPLGGLLVAGLIGKQGADLLIAALGELSDRGVEPSTLQTFDEAISQVQNQFPDLLKGWKDLRAVKSGVSTFADVTLQMPKNTTLEEAGKVEKAVKDAIMGSIKGVKEVRVRLDTIA